MDKNREEKKTIRQNLLKKRLSIGKFLIEEKSNDIIEKLTNLEDFKTAKNILLYYPIKNEVNLLPLIEINDKNFFLPIVDKENINIFIGKFNKKTRLKSNKYSIPEPCEIAKDIKLDIIILPGIAFDKNKNRIGYGKGFFDRYLKDLPKDTKKIAVAFEFQIVDKIKEEKHDKKIDYIITEENIY